MNAKNKSHLSLIIWILALIAIGWCIGSLTNSEDSGTWYILLNRSSLTPPNYIFPVAWTVLYGIIGSCGWVIWRNSSLTNLSNINVVKTLYVVQLILNWSWTPLFFHYHLTLLSLIVLGVIDIIVAILVFLSYEKIRTVSILMIPYLLWIIFASYLNFYVWQYN